MNSNRAGERYGVKEVRNGVECERDYSVWLSERQKKAAAKYEMCVKCIDKRDLVSALEWLQLYKVENDHVMATAKVLAKRW